MSETPERHPFASGRPADLSEWEVEADHVAESYEQGAIIRVLFSSLEELIALRGWTRVLPGADNYFAWRPERPMVRVSPDVYLLDDPPEPIPRMWQTWLPGNPPPRWAVEIVSVDWRKDYDEVPRKYEELGCRELAIFDPDAVTGQAIHRSRVPLTVYRRTGEGRLARAYSGAGPAFSQELGVWLIPLREGYSARLRLSEDPAGTKMVPTSAEAKQAERAARRSAEERVATLERELRGKKPR